MPEQPFTIIDDERLVEVPVSTAGGRGRLSPEALRRALGWDVGADGLCCESLCVPVPPGSSLVTDDGVDLAELAAILDRPLAVDVDERAACLGVSARERSAALLSLRAPSFTLPDLAGRPHSLAEARGKKVLLVAYASW